MDAAKKEKELVIYTTTTLNVLSDMVNNFKKKYPFLKVGFVRASTNKIMTRIMAETRAGKNIADVYLIKSPELNILRDKNNLIKYVSPESKNYREEFKKNQGFWTNGYLAARVIGFNTRFVSKQEAPKSYEDLLDPKWKGKIGLPREKYAWFGMILKAMGEEKGISYFKKLVKQDLQYHYGLTLNASLLAAGEFSILALCSNRAIENLKDQGAPVEWNFGGPVVVEMTAPAISAKASHPNAGKLLVDYYLSRKNQEFLRDLRYITLHSDVAPDPPRMLPDKKLLYSTDTIYKELGYYTKLYESVFPK
jgi:iron(III) transport system substrate-binding protein